MYPTTHLKLQSASIFQQETNHEDAAVGMWIKNSRQRMKTWELKEVINSILTLYIQYIYISTAFFVDCAISATNFNCCRNDKVKI